MTDLDVLVFGGGVAGLWALDALRRSGWNAALVEAGALGSGQTVASQGIIHGGGKYMLLEQADGAAVEAIRGMPARWLDALAGRGAGPDLSAARILSPGCLLWVPRGSTLANLKERGLMAIVVGTGMLAAKPVEVSDDQWPAAIRASALKVWSMPEPVLDPGSVVEALAAAHRGRVFAVAERPRFEGEAVRFGSLVFRPRAVVFAAGEGNGELSRAVGCGEELMQRRPLAMTLLRGPALSPLYGHCVVGGKTRITVTSAQVGSETVWSIGGEVAEKCAAAPEDGAVRTEAAAELRRWIPGLDLSACRIATFRAVRAEARNREHRRPSGVEVRRVADRPPAFVAWPTKLALAPVLADEIAAQIAAVLSRPAAASTALPAAVHPPVAPPPWETASWHPVP